MLKRACRSLAGALCCAVLASAAAAQQADYYREQINKGTVGVISGGIDGTYIRIATDLASVLDNGDDIRVLAIMGKGSVQNIDDILYLRGIDIGIVQSDVFTYIKRQKKHPNIGKRIRYITKLYNEEFHLLVHESIRSIEDLAGKKVNFGVAGSGTFMTASIVFDTLNIAAEPVSFDQGLAVEKIKSGEIAGTVYVAGKPTALFKNIGSTDPVHFLEVPLTAGILETYLPSRLTNEDYPQLIAPGEEVRTLAVGAVMAVYNWQPDSPRYRKVSRFIDAFFTRFEEFQKPPRHRKWQEVSLTAVVPGWVRFGPAEAWLRRSATSGTGSLRDAFEEFLRTQAPGMASGFASDREKQELFELFLLWQSGRAE
ncbi:MAG: TAXI family TRAP transporter solute-binding subunit [Kiloniellaceae bacterium]